MATVISDLPAEVNLRMYLEDTYSKKFIFPLDLTGCTARFTVKESKSSAANLVQKVVTDGDMTIDAGTPSTSFFVTITGADQINLTKGKYVYDLEIEFADGTKKTYLAGTFDVTADVT